MLDTGALAGALRRAVGPGILPRPFGPYELLEEVARGGMGIVYKARQPHANRIVAVKVLAAGQFAAPDFVKRFRTEAEAAASLDHPNIVPIYEVGECEGQPFFSMKFIEGGSLGGQISHQEFRPSNRAAGVLVTKLARAVHYAHQHGILHRDIKPGNVLLDAQGEPQLTDFGLAKLLEKESTLTRTMAMLGTPSYMSPEQARGDAKGLTTAVDVYGLGALFYELLTGQPPFAAGTTLETVRQVLEMEPRRPSALKPGIDADLETICLKCLEKDPAQRYGSAEALAADVDRWRQNEPILARPPSAAYKLQKSWRRNKLAYVGGLSVVLALVVGLAMAAAGWRQARKDRDIALTARSDEQAQRNLAGRERDLAQDRLYESLVREAHSLGIIRPLGYRRELLDRIRQALAIPTARKNLDDLRSEAAQCLGDPMGLDKTTLVDPPQSVLDFELNTDGSLVAFATATGQVVLYETAKGTAVTRLPIPGNVVQLAFAPEAQVLFGRTERRREAGIAGFAQTGLIEWLQGGDGSWARGSERSMPGLRRLIITKQGVIAACQESANAEIRFIEVGTDRDVGTIRRGANESFPGRLDLALAKRLAVFSGSSDPPQTSTSFVVWDLVSQQPRMNLDPGLGQVHYLSFSPDGRFLACTTELGVIVYETSQFRPVHTYREFASSAAVWGGDGTILCLPLGQENGVRLFSINSGTELARLRTPYELRDLRCSSDGSVLVASPASGDTPVVRLVDTHERLRLTGHAGGVPGVEFSHDGSKVASTGKDGTICIWDATTGKVLRTWDIQGRLVEGQTVCFSPNDHWVASGNYHNNQVLLWSLQEGRPLLALGDGRPGSSGTWSCAFSPDGKVLVAAGDGLRAWELASQPAGGSDPTIVARELFANPGQVRNLVFHPSGKWLGFQGTLRLDGQVRQGSFTRDLDPKGIPEFICGPDVAVQTLGIAAANGIWLPTKLERTLQLWDRQSRQVVRIAPTLTAGELSSSFVLNFRFSPDGSRIAVVNHNGTGVNLYDVASGRRLYSLPEEPGPVWWLAWDPDGRRLAVARSNGDISLWHLSAVEAVLAEVGLAP
jgi:WD40 repeat protein/predicted Ser/Thr protein kinase